MPELPHSEPDLTAHVRVISELAKMGRAPGQCPECHSFRMDGEPPVLHEPGCTHADDWQSLPGMGLGPLAVRREVFETREVAVMGRFTQETLTFTTQEDPVRLELVAKLHAHVLAKEIHQGTDRHEVSHPATWWQHLKADHLPAWFRRRWPVRYRKIAVDFDYRILQTYPEADVPVPPHFGKPHRLVEVAVFE